MINRIRIWRIALAVAATSLVAACQPPTSQSALDKQAAQSAADAAVAAKQAALAAQQEAPTFNTEKKRAEPRQQDPVQLAAMHKAPAMHAMDAKPAPGLKP